MNKLNWLAAAKQCEQQGEAYVLITILGVSGSTPRNSGTKMVITQTNMFDTIGGGHLEYKAIAHGQTLLQQCLQTGQNSQSIEHFQLAAQLGQCCGGSVSLLFECFVSANVNIMLFGAGHVGQALVHILSALPVKVTWVDNREQQFQSCLPLTQHANIHHVVSDDPCGEIASMPDNSYFIVMTHNHQLDFELCQTLLTKAPQFKYLGLIASNTKWRRFQQRFAHKNIAKQQVQRIHCPIGLPIVTGKKPMEVAVSIAGEIISLYQQTQPAQQISTATVHEQSKQAQGIAWKTLKPFYKEQTVKVENNNE